MSVLSTYVTVATLQLTHYPDSLKTITCNDGMDSRGDDGWTVTQMAGDEVDQGTWGTVTVPLSDALLGSMAPAITNQL